MISLSGMRVDHSVSHALLSIEPATKDVQAPSFFATAWLCRFRPPQASIQLHVIATKEREEIEMQCFLA